MDEDTGAGGDGTWSLGPDLNTQRLDLDGGVGPLAVLECGDDAADASSPQDVDAALNDESGPCFPLRY